jgi:hypothetical protein
VGVHPLADLVLAERHDSANLHSRQPPPDPVVNAPDGQGARVGPEKAPKKGCDFRPRQNR